MTLLARAASPSFLRDGERLLPPTIAAPCLSYKFRSEKTGFKPLKVARHEYGHTSVLDVKRSIIAERGLGKVSSGRSPPEFDLSLSNSESGEEYVGDAKKIPPGVLLVVQRLPAGRGLGLLSRISRADAGLAPAQRHSPKKHGRLNDVAAKAGFYTFVVQDRDDELIGGSPKPSRGDCSAQKRSQIADSIAKQWPEHNNVTTGSTREIMNPDPELRQMEKQLRPEKRIFGTPRTLRNMKLDANVGSRKHCGKNTSLDTLDVKSSEHENRSKHGNKMKRTHHAMACGPFEAFDEMRKCQSREKTKRRKGIRLGQADGKEHQKHSGRC